MDERIRTAVGDEPAWVVGGALRDEFLGRELVDIDVACADPELAARLYSRLSGGAVFPLSERHGAWRVALPGREHGRLHPAPRRDDRGGPRDAGLHGQRSCPLARGRRADRPARGRGRPCRQAAARGRPGSVRGRPAAPPARGQARGRARVPAGRDDGGARPGGRRPRRGSRGRAHPRRARAALPGRLPPRRRARAPGAPRRVARRPRPRRPGGYTRLPAGSRVRRRAQGLPRLQRPLPARPHPPGGRAPRRRLAACDPSLPAAHGTLGAVRARLPRRHRPLRRRPCGPGQPTIPSRCSAGRTSSSSGSSRGRRWDACWSWSPRSARSARSRPVTRHSPSCARSYPASAT